MYVVGPEQCPLCLDCYIRWNAVTQQEEEALERQYNHAVAMMEATTGAYGITPKYPERQPRAILHTGNLVLNNINVTNSEVGVLNTGTIQNVDSTVTVLKNDGNSQLADAISTLSEAVIKSIEISDDQKNQILELLSAVSQEAVVPKEKRRASVVKALLNNLADVVGSAASLAKIWEKVSPILHSIF